MLTVRKEQIDALAQEYTRLFHQRVLKTLRKNFPPEAINKTDDALLKEIAEVHQNAKAYGITAERSLFKFISLGIIAGRDFDKIPAVQVILQNNDLTPKERVDVLTYALKEHESKMKRG